MNARTQTREGSTTMRFRWPGRKHEVVVRLLLQKNMDDAHGGRYGQRALGGIGWRSGGGRAATPEEARGHQRTGGAYGSRQHRLLLQMNADVNVQEEWTACAPGVVSWGNEVVVPVTPEKNIDVTHREGTIAARLQVASAPACDHNGAVRLPPRIPVSRP